jgi:hypothetical protein
VKMPKAAQKKAAPAPKSTVEIIEVEQGSEAWFEAKLGIPSASRFADIMAGGEGKMRTRYLRELAGEIITGRPAETFKGAAMVRGNEMEAQARDHYARTRFADLRQVGFVKNSGLMRYAVAGASPDALIGEDGGLEIKTMIPALMIDLLEKGSAMPPEHRAQVQGNMWVCEREWWDFKIYYPRMPDFTVRVMREDTFIADIQKATEIFSYDLKVLVDKLRKMGATG